MFQALVKEEQHNTKRSIAELISYLYHYEIYRNTWPEILEFTEQFVTNEELIKTEVRISI